MKHIKLSTEEKEVKSLLKDYYDPYDGSPSFENFIPKGIWFILYEEECPAGLINLEQINSILWNTHVIVYDNFRGKNSYVWGQQVAEFMHKYCGAKKFIGFTPYVQAKRYAEKMGFKYVGILTDSIQKHGKLLDQFILELNYDRK